MNCSVILQHVLIRLINICTDMVVAGENGRDVWWNEIHGDNYRTILLTSVIMQIVPDIY
jgi:hypothetical protein